MIIAFAVLVLSSLLTILVFRAPVNATAGINQQINFQGRLLNAQGAVVPDGYYNIEFKIYDGGSGQAAGDPGGTLDWTENYLNANSQGVEVKDGYLSVQLGSINPFGSQVNWNSNTLWLSMNVAGTGATCTPFANCSPDGEMIPMKRLSSNAYSLNSAMLGGLTSAQFLQLGQGIQTDSSANSSIAVNKTGAGDFLQFQANGEDALTVDNSGDLTFGNNANHNISVATAASGGGKTLTVSAGNAASGSGANGGNLILQGGAGDGSGVSGGVIVQSNGTNSATAFAVQNTSSSTVFSVNTASSTVQVGSATANTNPDLFVLNNYSSGTDPTGGTNGAMYYNTSTNSFRCYVNGAWSDCSGAHGNFVQLGPSTTQVDSSNNSSIFINKTGSGDLMQLQANGSDAFSIDGSGNINFGNNADHDISVAAAMSGTGNSLNISGGNAASGNGGNVNIQGGAGAGSGANGLVVLSKPTFSTTTNDANCYTGGALVASSCTIAQTTVDDSSSAIIGFSQSKQTATLPPPTNKTPGQVFYISAAPGSQDFTLSVNGGGTGNEVAMRQDTSATEVWNGSAWGAAGASSSTDLQAAYDNTLQSAGGAELIVSHTANTNGLTIRDSITNPVNGPLLSVQTNSAATLFSVNSNVTEYASDGGAEIEGGSDSTFPANTWASIGSASVSRYTTVGDYIATGQGSVQVTTTNTAGDGVGNVLDSTLTPNQHYDVSFAARLTSGAFTDLYVYYSVDGTAQSIPCTTQREVISSVWTKLNCSFTAPSSGITANNAILIGQTSGVARTFYVDNLSVTIAADYNYATDGGVDDAADFSTNWPAVGGAQVSRSTSYGNDASDSAQVTTTAINQGISNKLSVAPLASTLYLVTVYAASETSGFDDFTVTYTPNGGTNSIPCVDYNTQSVTSDTGNFTEINCYIHTDTTAATAPYVYFTQADGTGRTFFVDTFSLTLATDTTPNIQIGGGQNGGPTTLFTLDSAASAPIASNNEQLLGSMYYDTTLGKIQCYEATGWGSCGSASNTIVTISPEYTNAVMHGTGVGTMTSDICSGTLHINDGSSGQPTICASDETYNFYKWTSPQATPQTYSIYVTYQLPDTFNDFLAASTSLMGRTDSSNATVQYTIYRDSSTSGLVPCGTTVAVSSGSVSSWQIGKASGAADPATCSFEPDDSIVFKIDVVASQDADAYVGNLNFTFTNK